MNVLHFLYPSRIILYIYKTCKLSCFSHVQLLATLWTVAYQSPLHMGFSRQGYWSGLPCHPPRGLPDPRIEPMSLTSPALTGGFFTTGSPRLVCMYTHTHTHTHTHIAPFSNVYAVFLPYLQPFTQMIPNGTYCVQKHHCAFSPT